MTDVNNAKTQLLIILEHYKTKMEEKGVPDQGNNVTLSEINEIDYRVNYGTLAGLRLIQADKDVSITGQDVYTPMTGIDPSGVILVEQFLQECVKDCISLDNTIRPYLYNLLELEMMWDENENLYQKHIQLMASLIRAIN